MFAGRDVALPAQLMSGVAPIGQSLPIVVVRLGRPSVQAAREIPRFNVVEIVPPVAAKTLCGGAHIFKLPRDRRWRHGPCDHVVHVVGTGLPFNGDVGANDGQGERARGGRPFIGCVQVEVSRRRVDQILYDARSHSPRKNLANVETDLELTVDLPPHVYDHVELRFPGASRGDLNLRRRAAAPARDEQGEARCPDLRAVNDRLGDGRVGRALGKLDIARCDHPFCLQPVFGDVLRRDSGVLTVDKVVPDRLADPEIERVHVARPDRLRWIVGTFRDPNADLMLAVWDRVDRSIRRVRGFGPR